ncbi:SAM-dependent methyltransferase [Thiorhodovibrio frisius]|uniref:O-methyltransferase n=1 Tax=Thiorhodovibrio frisius TaxID=631362 RepID=H8Z1Y1_9GAMM|nr:SAM-dependent methyltransferase [Thiorhodovibrio frisius]EIC22609.1 hypothetical protein Thi970DRAFT_02883 [Thiorhodovibrio frisius]WPL20050.1 Demethylmacrocin O-methyltransferase [Thiorhodovibrio frisius]
MNFESNYSLDDLGRKHKTDKSSKSHNYLAFYELFFSKFREDKFSLLELGVGPKQKKGKSLLVWMDYFAEAHIVGVDLRPDTLECQSSRVTIEIGNSGDLDFLLLLAKKYPANRIIIDDASHKWAHQILAFEVLFKTVEKGGCYIVEDIHTSFSPLRENENYANSYEDAYTYFSTINFLVCGGGRHHPSFELSKPTPMQRQMAKDIESVSIYKSTILINKK